MRFHRERVAAVVDLSLTDEAGNERTSKTLVSERGACDEVGAAAAFAVATLLDPRAMFPKPPPARASVASLDSHEPGTWPWYEAPPLPPPAAFTPPPTPRVRGHLGALAVGCSGCGPSLTPGAAVFGGISRSHVGLDLVLRTHVETSATTASGQEVSSSLAVGELFPHARSGILRFGPALVLGALFGETRGERQVSTWAAAGARAGVDLPLGTTFFVRGVLDGLFVLNRVSLRVDGRELWSTPGFAATVGVGVGVTL